jgi:hypothetical protein
MIVRRKKTPVGEIEGVGLFEIDVKRPANGSAAADGLEAEAELAGRRVIDVEKILEGLRPDDEERLDLASAVRRKF